MGAPGAMVAAGGAAGRGVGRGADGMLGTIPAPGSPAGGRDPASPVSTEAPGNGWRGPERIWPGLGAGGAGRAGIGIPRGATGCAEGCPSGCPCPEASGPEANGPDASGGRSGADRAAGGASTGISRVGCAASATGSCLGTEAARDGSAPEVAGPASATCSTAVSTSGDARRGDPLDSPVSRRFTSSATGSSIELEWVFFSATPSSGSMSRITFGLTSSSRASSLIRILTILCAPPSNCDTGVVRFYPAPYPEPLVLPETLQFLS
jgi:hypothetical protein